MRLEQLIYYTEVVNLKNMHAASKTLYTSVQNISKSIKNLESELGVPLLYRTKYGFAPTGDGKIIYEKAMEIRNAVETIKDLYLNNTAAPINSYVAHNIKVASVCSMTIRLRQIVYRLNQNAPSIGFSFHEYEGNALNKIFKSASTDYDFFFLASGDKTLQNFIPYLKDYDIYVLCIDQLGLSINRKNPFSKEKHIPLAALSKIPLASFQESEDKKSLFFSILSENGYHITNKPLYISNNHAICNDYVEQNKAAVIACVPDIEYKNLAVSNNDVRALIPFKEPVKIVHLMVFNKHLPLSSECAAFKKEILKFFQNSYYRFTN